MIHKNNLLRCAYLIPMIVLASCSWMGSADLPRIDKPNSFRSASVTTKQIESLPYLAWWQQFNDENLNSLIESGLKSNLDVSIALSNLEQARGQLRQIQLSWIPFINLYSGFSSNPAFGDIGTFYGAWPQYIINIAQQIEMQKQAKYNLQMKTAMVDGVRLTLIGQISASYFSLIAQERQLDLLEQLNQDLQAIIDLGMQEIKIGIRDNIELDSLRSQQHLVQAQIAIAKHNVLLSNNSISYLLNQNPHDIKNKNNFNKLDFTKFKPSSMPATVLQNRPDIKIAEYTLQTSHSGVGVAYGGLFPSLQLDSFFGAGSRGGTIGSPNMYSPMEDAYINWGINPATFGEIEARKGVYQAQVYAYIQTVRKALRDVDNSLSANNQYDSNYLKTSAALLDLKNKYSLQEGLYKTGIMSYPALLQSKIDVDNIELTANQAKLQQALALVNLYQELAGGYKYESGTDTTKDNVSK